jgi:hypothetical protein
MNSAIVLGAGPMKFTLIYDGPLPPSDSKRALYAAKIRNQMHVQLKDLWDSHVLMRELAHKARVYNRHMADLALQESGPILTDYAGPPPPLKENQIDLTLPIKIKRVGSYKPIVRASLYLACDIDITFLRHEEPAHLFEHSGDLDNRLKCFFDALTIPNVDQANAGEDPCADPLCCLLENDRFISGFSVRSGRLLGKGEKDQYDVRIQADITLKVLRVFDGNMGLIGG